MSTFEERIASLVEGAIDKLYTEKDKKQVVIELARDLESLIPMDTICTEITNRLQDYLKARTIRDYLDERYKIKSRVANAKKQMNKQSGFVASEPSPLNQTKEINGLGGISDQYAEDIQPTQTKDSAFKDNNSIGSQQNPLQLSQQQKNYGLKKLKAVKKPEEKSKKEQNIEMLHIENSEKEEIIRKFNPFTTANNIMIFKEGMPIWEIIEFIKSDGLKNDDRKIHFRIEFDKNTTRILSFGLLK